MDHKPISITVKTRVKAPIGKTWAYWTEPAHITEWNNSSDDWHTPFAENDLRVGGKLLARMESKDGTEGFDFGGIYDELILNEVIAFAMDDGRKVRITFSDQGSETEIIETFDAEEENSIDLQRSGWQAILDNFKHYVEQ